jgi:hypothetical protein
MCPGGSVEVYLKIAQDLFKNNLFIYFYASTAPVNSGRVLR